MESPPSTGATLHPEFCPSRQLTRPTISSRGVNFRFSATQGEPGSLSAPLRWHVSGVEGCLDEMHIRSCQVKTSQLCVSKRIQRCPWATRAEPSFRGHGRQQSNSVYELSTEQKNQSGLFDEAAVTAPRLARAAEVRVAAPSAAR